MMDHRTSLSKSLTGKVFLGDNKFHNAKITYSDGIIESVELPDNEQDNDDLACNSNNCMGRENGRDDFSKIIVPGFVDTHLHGCMGADLSDAIESELEAMARYELEQGITTFCPATMTLPEDELMRIAECVDRYESGTGANLAGIYMEGPFINSEKCGAQRKECIKEPDYAMLEKFIAKTGNHVKVVTIAPETNGSMEFLESIRNGSDFGEQCQNNATGSKGISVAAGHTMMGYDEAITAFEHGVNRITHYYNAMGFAEEVKRAILDYSAANPDWEYWVELICDGIHNSRERISDAFDAFGAEHIILISDSMRATGLGDGEYTLGGQRVTVKERLAVIDNGSKAGSVTNLMECFRCALDMGISMENALMTTTVNPAKSIGIDSIVGVIAKGMRADMLVLNKDLEIEQIICRGEMFD